MKGVLNRERAREILLETLFLGNFRKFEIYFKTLRDVLSPKEKREFLAFYYLNTLQLRKLKKLLISGSLPERTVAQILFYLGYLKEAQNRIKKLLSEGSLDRRTEFILLLALNQIKGLRYNLSALVHAPDEKDILNDLYKYALANLKAYSGNLVEAISLLREAKESAILKGAEHLSLSCHVFAGFLSGSVADLDLIIDTAKRLKAYRILVRAKIYRSFLLYRDPPHISKGYRYFKYMAYLVRSFNLNVIPRIPEDLRGVYNVFWYVDKVRRNTTYLSFARRLRLMKGKDEIRIPRHLLITLAYLKLLGKEGVYSHASLIFQKASVPIKRVWNNLSALKPYFEIPTDADITLRWGNFLLDEDEDWAEVLKSTLLPRE